MNAAEQSHMSPDEFRAHGHQVIDWIADYWESLRERPVLSQVAPGSISDALPTEAPVGGESFDRVLSDLDEIIMPGITHWAHPRFFAYFPANSSPAAVLGDLISSGIGAQGMLWSTSPAATEVEQVVTDWLAKALGIDEWAWNASGTGGGVIHDTASTATFTAVLAALHRASGGAVRDHGTQDGRHYTLYASTEAHSSLLKAAMMAGVGHDNVRQIPVDPQTQAMRPDALRDAIESDLAAGRVPTLIQSAVGTTATCAIDPTVEIGQIAATHGIWLHVDAAFAGVAAVCPEHRSLMDGVNEYADSLVTNPHKWMLTTFDCSAFWVRSRDELTGALSILPEYLRNSASAGGEVVDYRDWHPQLGRRFRALKLWSVLRTYGISGVQAHIRSGVALAERLEHLISADPRFELALPRSLSLVCFRLREHTKTEALMNAVNSSGLAYLTHTKLDDAFVIRAAVGGVWSTKADIDDTWQAISDTATQLEADAAQG